MMRAKPPPTGQLQGVELAAIGHLRENFLLNGGGAHLWDGLGFVGEGRRKAREMVAIL